MSLRDRKLRARLDRLVEEYEADRPSELPPAFQGGRPFLRDVTKVRQILDNEFHGLDEIFYALRVSPLSEEGYWIEVMYRAFKLTDGS